MKKLFFILIAAILFYPAAAQKVTVKDYEDNRQKGYLIFLEKDPAKYYTDTSFRVARDVTEP